MVSKHVMNAQSDVDGPGLVSVLSFGLDNTNSLYRPGQWRGPSDDLQNLSDVHT